MSWEWTDDCRRHITNKATYSRTLMQIRHMAKIATSLISILAVRWLARTINHFLWSWTQAQRYVTLL